MNGKTVLITGAAGGLGKALVGIFLENGFRVIATDVLGRFPEDTRGEPGFSYQMLDVTDPGQISALKDNMGLNSTGLDILISAAGIYDSYPVTEAKPELFRKMMAVNLHGTANMVQGMLDLLVRRKGRVVVISSESHKIQAMFQPYMISKSALEAYCRSARQELAMKGVRLSVIRPGAIDTPLLKWMRSPAPSEEFPVFGEEFRKSWAQSTRMVGRIAGPEAVARVVFRAATAKNPKRVYRVNNNPMLRLVSVIPGPIMDRLAAWYLRMAK